MKKNLLYFIAFLFLSMLSFGQTPATHLNFDGSNDVVTVASPFKTFTNQITVEAWINKTGTAATRMIASQANLNSDNWTTSNQFIFYVNSTNKIIFTVSNGSGAWITCATTNSITTNTWTHVAAVASTTGTYIYIDGVLSGSAAGISTIISNATAQLNIGRDVRFPANASFNGNIDEVRVWNTALTVTEINNRKDCELKGNESGLVAYYKFNQGNDAANNSSVTTSNDSSPIPHNGTLTNFSLNGATSNWLAGSPIATLTAPTAAAQSFCTSATVANLVATGTALQWYDVATGGIALASTTSLATGTYYVSQTLNSCESERTAVSVTITQSSQMTVDAGPATVTYCANTITPITANPPGFQEAYAPTNWTFANNNANGNVNTTNAPASISITGGNSNGNNVGGSAGDSTYSMTFTINTTISFNWVYTGTDATDFDYPQVLINGTPTLFQGYVAAMFAPLNQSGTMTVNVLAGQTFGFNMHTVDNSYGAASVTISNFVDSNSNISYSWSATNGGSITGATNTASMTPATSGTYTVTATNGAGCNATDSVAVIINATPAEPTVTSPQIYTGTATIANLTATGTGIQWYAAASGGTALATSTALVDGTTYYASQTLNSCESTRTAVTVQKISDATQTLCGPATVANLVSTPTSGTTANWFTTASGGTALVSTDVITAGTYYVEQNSPASVTTLSSGSAYTYGVAIQDDGKIVVADYSNNIIKRMNADGTGIVTLGSGFTYIFGVAIQTDGKIVVADAGHSAIKRMNADGTGIVTLGSGFNHPTGVAIQTDGKIVYVDYQSNVLKRMNADGTGIIESLAVGFNFAYGVAIQADGKIVVADTNNNVIKRMNADGSGIVILGSGFNHPYGVAIQADGKIVVADTNNNVIKRMNADGSGIVILGSGIDHPYGVAIQADGKIIVAGYGAIKRITEANTSNRVAVSVTVNTTLAPTASAQSFCGSFTVADLVATGTALQWYDATTGGTALATTTALATGTYYVSQTLNSCESERTAVSVTVNVTPAPTATTQNFCQNTVATVADLVATGTTLQWYDVATGGTALASSTELMPGYNTYYVSQTINGCESVRTSKFVQYYFTTTPTGNATQTITNANPTISDIVVTGSNLFWFASEADALAQQNALPTTTIVTNGSTYYVISYVNNGCASVPFAVTVTVNTAQAPTAINPQVYTGTGTIANLTATGTAIQWYAAATGGTALATSTALVDGSTYYASQTVNSFESTRTPVTVHKISEATQTFCGATTVANLVSTPASGTTANWFTTATGGTAMASTDAVTTGTYYVEQNTVASITYLSDHEFDSPFGVAVQADGKIVFPVRDAGIIIRMNADGTGPREILGPQFYYPRGVAIQADGKILVAVEPGDIKRMNADGTGIVNLRSGFSLPTGVAVQADGKIVVADNNGVERMNADGTGIETLGIGFSSPQGVAIQADGKIVVADTYNNVIKRMNADGTGIVTLGGGFINPYGVAIQADGKIVVADTGNFGLKRMNTDGTNIVTLNGSGIQAYFVAIQADGSFIVVDAGFNSIIRITEANTSNRVAVNVTVNNPAAPTATNPQVYAGTATIANLTATGTGTQWYAASTGGTALDTSTALVDGTTYYASQTLSSCESTRTAVTVQKISEATQTFCGATTVANLVSTPSSGTIANWFTTETGGTAMASTDAVTTGTYYVEQNTVASVTTLGSGFNQPSAVAIQADGKIVVADWNNNAIKRMNADGTGIEILGSGFSNPTGVAIQADGKIVVADNGNVAIKRMNADGTGIETLVNGINVFAIAIQADGKIVLGGGAYYEPIKRINADGSGLEILASGISYEGTFGIAVQTDGKILVAAILANNDIMRMNADGTNIETLGSGFWNPAGIAIQSDGKIVVADSNFNAIKRMNADGTGIETLASGFYGPFGVAIQADGKIVVADTFNNAIKRITEANTSNRVAVNVTVNNPAAPTATNPQVYAGTATIANLTVTGTGTQWYAASTGGTALDTSTALVDGTTYYASQTVNSCESTRTAVTVQKISEATQTLCGPATVANLVNTPTSGTTANWFTTATGGTAMASTDAITAGTYYVEQSTPTMVTTIADGFLYPYGVAIQADSKILVADNGNNAIKRMNADGTGIETLGSGFNQPNGVAIQSDGKIVVADTSNDAIKRMNADGSGIETLGSGFFRPHGVAIQADGKILIADTVNNVIKRMNADGTNIETLGSGFNFPTGVAIQSDGKIVVADTGNDVIKRMNADGSGIETLGSGFSLTFGVAIQADGKIVLTDYDVIKRMNADGSSIETFGSGAISQPFGVAIQADGKIVVADFGNNTIKRITEANTSNRVAVSVTVNTTPAPTASTQSFCGSFTVADLVATGTTLQWYDVATGGTALASTTALASGTYYVSQTLNSCESERTAVSVTLNVTPAPTATTQNFCQNTVATVADLVATGTTLQWYDVATGGTALASTTALATGTYYVSQTLNSCESERTAVSVTVNPQPTVDAGPATVTYCANAITPITAISAPTTSDGFQGSYAPANWTFVNGIPSDGNVDTTNAPASITITGGNSYGGNFGGLPGDSTYYIMVTTPTTISFNWVYNTNHDPLYDYPQVIVNGNASFLQGYDTVGLNTQSGTMSISIPADQTFAFNMFTADNNNGAATVTISNLVITNSDATYSWAATDGGTIIGATNTASMTPATSGTYTVTATNTAGCTATDSVAVTINTTPAPTAADQWVCYGTTFANVVATGTDLQWYDAATGGTAYSSTAIVPFSQNYYVSQTIDGCESPRTAVSIGTEIVGAPEAPLPTLTVTVTGNCDSFGGTYEQIAEVNGKNSYYGSAQIFFNGTYWVTGVLGEFGNPDIEFFTNTDVSNGIYPPTTGWVNLIACSDNELDLNNVLTLTINSTSQQFCTGATISDIVINGDFTINWFDVATGGTALASTTAITTGTYYASQTSPTGCESERTAVSVTVNTTPAPTASAQSFCGSETVADLVATGTALQWYDVATGGTALASTTALATGTYYVSQTLNSCESERTTVSVTLNVTPAPTAANQWVCYGTTFANVVATGTALQWYDAATGGTAYSSTAIVPFSQTYYVSQTIDGCESPRTAVSIGTEIVGAPQAPLPTLTVTVTGNCDSSGGIYEQVADVNGKKSYNYNAGFQIFFNGTYWVAGILGEVGIPQMEFFTNTDVSNGLYPPTTGWVNLIACGENIELNNVLTLTINSTSQQFCTEATVADIVINGDFTINWFDVATGGTALASTTAITTGTYYASQTSPTGCESERTAVSVTVNVTPAPTATTQNFCQNTVATVADLVATGTTLQWYDVATGGIALASSTELMPGYNTYYVSQTINGCESVRTSKFVQYYLTTTPTGNATQTLTNANPTISDIVVTGSNLIWFASEADALAQQNALPTTTIVTNGSTYFVISYVNNGCASVPFAVTVTVTLVIDDFDTTNFNYYPNPTSSVLNIEYSKTIESVSVFNLLGQILFENKTNSTSVQIDLSNLATATYYVKVKADEKEKTIKIVKQ